jgi:hypothetical protein
MLLSQFVLWVLKPKMQFCFLRLQEADSPSGDYVLATLLFNDAFILQSFIYLGLLLDPRLVGIYVPLASIILVKASRPFPSFQLLR